MGIFIALLLATTTTTTTTPEQEVDAWQPSIAEREADARSERQTKLLGLSVGAPLAAASGGIAVAFVAGVSTSQITHNGPVAGVAAATAGVVVFESLLGLTLWTWLPADFPSWALPGAMTAALLGAAAGFGSGAALTFAWVSVVYRGSDCLCGPELLFGAPLAITALTVGGATVATVLTTSIAALE